MGSGIRINREETNETKKLKGWILLYGRRKVGKTFLIKNFLDWDYYFMVRRDGKILVENYTIKEIENLRDFIGIISDMLKKNKTIVIDEFQRLPSSVIEEIGAIHPNGKIIFSGSSFRLIKKIMKEKSPLLGLVLQYKLALIRPLDIIGGISKYFNPVTTIELCPFFRDAWTLSFLEPKIKDSIEMIYNLLSYSKFTILALVGEIFTEEDRALSKVYEAILRTIGAGKWNYKEVADTLYGRSIISKADSSIVLPYVKNLEEMGLIETLPLFQSKKNMYKLTSPIMEAFFYLSDRYNFDERDTSLSEIKPTLERIKSFAVQNFVADIYADHLKGRKEYYVTPEKEIDFIITVRRKPVLVGEVKWGNYTQKDIEKFIEKTKHLYCEKVFVVKKKHPSKSSGVDIVDAEDLLKLVK